MKSLKEPNLVVIFIGIVLGLALGDPVLHNKSVLLQSWGWQATDYRVSCWELGIWIHMITYTTRSANLMLRSLWDLYAACSSGTDAGAHFLRYCLPSGRIALDKGLGAGLTIIPNSWLGLSLKIMKIDFAAVYPVCCAEGESDGTGTRQRYIPGDNLP